MAFSEFRGFPFSRAACGCSVIHLDDIQYIYQTNIDLRRTSNWQYIKRLGVLNSLQIPANWNAFGLFCVKSNDQLRLVDLNGTFLKQTKFVNSKRDVHSLCATIHTYEPSKRIRFFWTPNFDRKILCNYRIPEAGTFDLSHRTIDRSNLQQN